VIRIVLMASLFAATRMFAVLLFIVALLYVGSLVSIPNWIPFLGLFGLLLFYEIRLRHSGGRVVPTALRASVSAAVTMACVLVLPGMLMNQGVSLWVAFLAGYAMLVLVFVFRGRPRQRSGGEAVADGGFYGAGDAGEDSGGWFDGWGDGGGGDGGGGDGGGDGD